MVDDVRMSRRPWWPSEGPLLAWSDGTLAEHLAGRKIERWVARTICVRPQWRRGLMWGHPMLAVAVMEGSLLVGGALVAWAKWSRPAGDLPKDEALWSFDGGSPVLVRCLADIPTEKDVLEGSRHGARWCLWWIAVHHDHRRKGVAREIVRAACEACDTAPSEIAWLAPFSSEGKALAVATSGEGHRWTR